MTILQTSIPYDPLKSRPLPGIQPLAMDDWLHFDDAFSAQMQRRAALLDERRDDVLALDHSAEPAAQELLNLVLHHAYPGCLDHATRPDGQIVEIDRTRPLETLCRLVQEDFCILQKQGDEHVLTGAILCFPASWRLSEKFMRPLVDIHIPVASYDANIARRVQRLFDGIQPERPLWRFNALWYADAELYQPRSATEPRHITDPEAAGFLRSERQTLLRLPQTRAVVFSIHTYVLLADRLRKMENPA
ncbi:heme-dependent oxidative N-demethylase family protein [Ruegeria profundi]|uniref:heme-dependent oxidative N-demethylase family protein n=1 Tax=Ruegeria profundi TaxID=1685378 RepID=UPI001CD7B85B|nr:DUF3445 domain-containing protein [Ruegeria profundi]MCA0927422.1 DUF3445 domain-containing protein [Ruegeria profundi]